MTRPALMLLGFLAVTATTACQATIEGGDGDVCALAADHVASCTGLSAGLDLDTCGDAEAAAAQTLLDTSCSDLEPPSDPAKADFWGDGCHPDHAVGAANRSGAASGEARPHRYSPDLRTAAGVS